MDKIYSFLTELHPEYDFKKDNGRIQAGILDSFDIISIVTMIEDHYDVLIDAMDIIPENFSSIDAVVCLIKKNGGII